MNSFSKYFSMTGWRIGWLLVPDELLDSVDRLAGNFTICPPALSQLAAVAAFDAYDELDANVARYRANRDAAARAAARRSGSIGWRPPTARSTSMPTSRAGRTTRWPGPRGLLADTGVAVAPGVDFDPVDGGKFIRMCFAGDGTELDRAVDLMGDWFGRL